MLACPLRCDRGGGCLHIAFRRSALAGGILDANLGIVAASLGGNDRDTKVTSDESARS